jgi:hypothetical protein
MISHTVETCPDDPAVLRERLDELAATGARILSVLWQPQRVDTDQSAAFEARGSFLIVMQSELPDPLRTRGDVDQPHDLGPTPLA